MNDTKIIVVPCRADMPLTGVVQNGLAAQFPGMVDLVPPPSAPQSLSNFLKPSVEHLPVLPGLVVVLVDSVCLKTRPGFVRALLDSPKEQEEIVIVADHHCEELLAQLIHLRSAERVLCADSPHGIVSLLLRSLEGSPHPAVRWGLRAEYGLGGIVGESQFIDELRQRLPLIAGSEASVLITGETGTGKEIVAHAVHYLSRRRRRPFVAVHCGAIPSDIFENEFFGHKAGAYTGAQGEQQGLIAQAHLGTLFLDEISTLRSDNQVKLLRVLQEGEYRPLGGGTETRADVRIIAASNTDLNTAVQQNAFRSDLLYRINTMIIDIPPLRARPEDIPPLADHFVRVYARRHGKDVRGFSPAALERLQEYNWLGNVRELQHVVERAVLVATGPEIFEVDIRCSGHEENLTPHTYREAKHRAVEQFDREFLISTLRQARGNISEAARQAGADRSSFLALLRKYNIGHGEKNER